MKVFILHTGEYEGRGIFSVHSTKEAAEAVYSRISRNWPKHLAPEPADIEEHEVDPSLCAVCGYEESLHISSPETWKHPFQSAVQSEGPRT